MLETVPRELKGPGRGLGGLTVYGDDEGLAERLVPLTDALTSSEAWVVVDQDRVVLVRQGELDASMLQHRLRLGQQVVAALT